MCLKTKIALTDAAGKEAATIEDLMWIAWLHHYS